MNSLPKRIDDVQVPPVKIQGIKTDLVDFISTNINWDGQGRWIEPFLGSGVVLFNIEPERALVADANEHIINLYKQIQDGEITGERVRSFLEKHGSELEKRGEDYYYQMRRDFNQNQNPLYMLFLNRSCYNGMMRFNLDGEFNVPFCKKPSRFRQRYISLIVNQVDAISKIMEGKDWVFKSWDWEKTLKKATADDFVYLDPPYLERNSGYIGEWKTSQAVKLSKKVQHLEAGYAMSTWNKNKYRENGHIQEYWDDHIIRQEQHFYHVGSKKRNRNEMSEALIIKDGCEAELGEIPLSSNG